MCIRDRVSRFSLTCPSPRAMFRSAQRQRAVDGIARSPSLLRVRRGKETSLIQTHAEVAEGLAPWVFVLFIVAAVLLWWSWNEREATAPRAPKWVALVLAVTAV